jgi:hypothetical protein
MKSESEDMGSRLSLRRSVTLILSAGWRKLGVLGVVALVAVAPVLSIQTEIAGAKLEQRLAQLRKHGEPIAVSELAPEPIADEANAATYYKQAFAQLTFTERSGLLGAYVLPETSQDDRTKLEPRVRELIRQNGAVFPVVEEASTHYQCVFPVDTKAVTGADWSYVQGLDNALHLLGARAIMEARDGEMNASVDDLLTSLRVSRATDADPLGFTFISGLSNRITAIWCVSAVSQSGPLTFEQTKDLFDELAQSSVSPALKRCVRGQRAIYNYYFTLLRGGRENLPAQDTGSVRNNPAIDRIYMMAGSIPAARIYNDQVSYLDLFDVELKLIDRPYSETVKAMQAMKGLQSYEFTWWGPFFDSVSAFSTNAHISCMQTGMAVKAYESRYGSYPENLGQVESKLGWKLPRDPYTKLPLRYHRQGNGFEVYSCGPNMKDDGGVINWGASSTGKDVGDMGYTWDE